MFTIPFVLSYIFGTISFLYAISGFVVFGIDSKKSLNKIFLFLSVEASIWSMMFSFGINSGNIDASYWFYTFAAIGYTFFYSNVLHMTRILTRKEINKKFLFFNYFPSFCFVIVFILSSATTYQPLQVVTSSFGFTYVFTHNVINYVFDVYAFVYVLLCLRNFKCLLQVDYNYKHIKYTRLVMYSFILSFILSIFSDFLLIDLLQYRVLYLAVI